MEKNTYCRICTGLCGLIVEVEDGKALSVRPDPEHPGSKGFICVKGLQYPEIHHGLARLRKPLKRKADETFEEINSERALDEVADRLTAIIRDHGPASVALFFGTASAGNQLQRHMAMAWRRAIGTPAEFSTMTIDQSAKWVAEGRLGKWAGGRQPFETADVWLLCGTNPLVSLQGCMLGLPTFDPVKRLKNAKARGMKLIVIDPVKTQTARHADLYLQPIPGEDPALFAAIIRCVLDNDWHDKSFCEKYVNGLNELRSAVEPFKLDYAAARCGVSMDSIQQAARLFAHDSQRGMAAGGTGPDMAPQSNLAEHLIESLNIICGRYNRAGDPIPNPGVMKPAADLYAEVIPPHRGWERTHKSRIGGYGMMYDSMMTGILADEILVEGAGQIRALFVAGGNPAGCMPDQQKAVRAMKSLDLLVTAEPRMSHTARLAHYVFAPKLALERPGHTHFLEALALAGEPFAQYTPAIVEPEADMDVIDDWYLYWALASRLGLQLTFCNTKLDMKHAPTSEELLEILAANGQVPYEEIQRHPNGKYFNVPERRVQPPRREAKGRFELMPADVRNELSQTQHTNNPDSDTARYTHKLVSRRVRETMNTSGTELSEIRRRMPYNPAHIHPDDLQSLGLNDNQSIEIHSETGMIMAVLKADPQVRPGVISMNHGWGGLPEDNGGYLAHGSATNLLVASDRKIETINAMPRMSAIPIYLSRPGAEWAE